ncbi:T9SS type A sorting domain-containing protein [bacterium]|nr:T9SS type A sorting domain-containing protein [bacterium]
MKRHGMLAVVVPMILITLLAGFSPISTQARTSAQTNIWQQVHSTGTGVEARLTLPELAIQQDDQGEFVAAPGLMNNDSPFPMIATLVAVPNNLGLTVHVTASDYLETGIESELATSATPLAQIGDPFTFRGIRLFPVAIPAGRVNDSGEVEVAETMDLQVSFSGNDGRAPGENGPRNLTEDSYRFLRSQVLNLDDLDINLVAPLGRLLIVGRSNLEETMLPYITWKRQQGYTVNYVTPSSLTSTAVKSTIQTQYNLNNPLPLEYVLIVGDHNGGLSMPGWDPPGGWSGDITDHYYTQLDGTNILGDVAIGRFSAQSVNELVTIINKTILYERDLYLEDSDWLHKVTLAAGNNSGISPIATNRTIKWMFNRQGIEADTMWWTMPGGDDAIPDFLVQTINAGVHFMNYRGFIGMSGWNNSDLNRLTNVARTPVVVTITCGTGSWGTETTALSEGFLRAGTASSPRGGVACIGTGTVHTHTRYNNVVDASIFGAMNLHNMRSFGWALVYGKQQLYNAYVGTSDAGGIAEFSYWNNLMGDPALRVWIGEPVSATVSHDAELPVGQNFLDVDVELPIEWPEMVWATLATPSQVIDSRRIDESGHIRLVMDSGADLDDLVLTVSGDNVLPYQSDITTSTASNYVAVQSFSIDDGDFGDGVANPGETIDLNLVLVNQGSSATSELSASLVAGDERLVIDNGSSLTIPALNPGATTFVNGEVTFSIPDWVDDGSRPELLLTVGEDQESTVAIDVVSYAIVLSEDRPQMDPDGDDRILPGESGDLYITVLNVGSKTATALTGTLTSLTEGVTISNPMQPFHTISVGEEDDNVNPFTLAFGEGLYEGQVVDLQLEFVDATNAVDLLPLTLTVGDPGGAGATGPDGDGYWAIDNSDTSIDLAPEFEWVSNISTENRLGINDTSNEDDESVAVQLPFLFAYYGEVYDEITVCSNGWLAMGDHSTQTLFRNWPIPNPNGPPAMIAPFWDDLLTNGGGVYASYDDEENRFVITWIVRTTTGQNEQFQAILYDPLYWPTHTGNGKILFQYNDIQQTGSATSDNDYATVGIESPDQTDGVEYSYWNSYSTGAAPLIDGRAILFTDDLSGFGGAAVAEFNPESFDVTLLRGMTQLDSVFINNTGDGALIWSMVAQDGEVGLTEWRNQFSDAVDQLLPGGGGNAVPLTELKRKSSKIGSGGTSSTQSMPKVSKDEGGLNDVVPLLNAGGPDEFGYVWRDSNEPDGPAVQWVSEFGTLLDTTTVIGGDPDDGYFPAVDIPFAFPFYATDYSQVWINSNGFVTFQGVELDPDSTWRNESMPRLTVPRGNAPQTVIAPWWDDLDMQAQGEVYVNTTIPDHLVITWSEIRGWGSDAPRGGPYSFQLVLTSSGRFFMNYLAMGEDRLDEATVGFQDAAGEIGQTIVHNAGYIQDNMTIEVLIPRIWLYTIDHSGLNAPGSGQYARFMLTAEHVQDGNYSGSLLFHTNDPEQTTLTIPVELTVGSVGNPPEVSDIPDQTVEEGTPFATIELDDYVTDDVWPDNRIEWEISGAEELIVGLAGRTVTLTVPDEEWSGSETLTFTATNPEDLSESDQATFAVTAVDDPPTSFSLLQPTDNSETPYEENTFEWGGSVDPEETAIHYDLVITREDQTVTISDIETTSSTVNLVDEGFPFNIFDEFSWYVIAYDETGQQTESSQTWTFFVRSIDVAERVETPTDFSIGELYPNPFNPTTSVTIGLPQAAPVKLQIFDVLGRQVTKLDYGTRTAGYHQLSWGGATHSSGIYFMVIDAGPMHEVRKAVLMK